MSWHLWPGHDSSVVTGNANHQTFSNTHNNFLWQTITFVPLFAERHHLTCPEFDKKIKRKRNRESRLSDNRWVVVLHSAAMTDWFAFIIIAMQQHVLPVLPLPPAKNARRCYVASKHTNNLSKVKLWASWQTIVSTRPIVLFYMGSQNTNSIPYWKHIQSIRGV